MKEFMTWEWTIEYLLLICEKLSPFRPVSSHSSSTIIGYEIQPGDLWDTLGKRLTIPKRIPTIKNSYHLARPGDSIPSTEDDDFTMVATVPVAFTGSRSRPN